MTQIIDKTHYRKAFNSPYLSSADIVGPTALTITRVALEPDRTKKTKDHFNTAYFAEREIRPGEPLKPMILNVHNSRVMKDLCGSPFIDDWSGRVTVYVDQNVKFGREMVEGLRITAALDVISEDQAEAIQNLLKQVSDADQILFFKWAKVDSVEELPAKKYATCVKKLEEKKRAAD